MASPASTIESLTKEFEHALDRLPSSSSSTKPEKHKAVVKSSSLRSGHSLDIKEATRGQFVVKPQDTDNAKAVKPEINEECKSESPATSISKGGNSSKSTVNRTVGHYSLGPHRLLIS